MKKTIILSTLFLSIFAALYCAVNPDSTPSTPQSRLLSHLDISAAIKYSHDCCYEGPELDKAQRHQPYIVKFSWDNITLRNTRGPLHSFGSKVGTKGDLILWNDGFQEWNWKHDGTSHSPGITGKSLENLVSLAGTRLPDVIILTRGVEGVLQTNSHDLDEAIKRQNKFSETKLVTAQDIKNFLSQKACGRRTIIRSLKSFDAVILYNALVNQGKNVAMLLHTTC